MTQTAFTFYDPLERLAKVSMNDHVKRVSGTIPGSVVHALHSTPSPNATVHHLVAAACPHPVAEKADAGVYYTVAYVSIPSDWVHALTPEMQRTWDVSFVGPSGRIQRLPPALNDYEVILGERLYVGFDWFWLVANGNDSSTVAQPTSLTIRKRLGEFVEELRLRQVA